MVRGPGRLFIVPLFLPVVAFDGSFLVPSHPVFRQLLGGGGAVQPKHLEPLLVHAVVGDEAGSGPCPSVT